MAYGVDGAVEAMELPPLNAVSYRPRPQPRAFKLPPRDDPMLSLCDFRHLEIGGVGFLTHVGT